MILCKNVKNLWHNQLPGKQLPLCVSLLLAAGASCALALKLIHRGLAGFNVIQQCHNQTAIQMASDLLRAGREIFFGTDHALSRLS